MNSNEFWKFVGDLCEKHGLVRAKFESLVVSPRQLGTKSLAWFYAAPLTDADMFAGGGSAVAIYETKDCEGNLAYEIPLGGIYSDMLCKPHLVEMGWKARAEQAGHTAESARAWLTRFSGCQDTDYYTWLADQQ